MESTPKPNEESNPGKKRSSLNRTLCLSEEEYAKYRHSLGRLDSPVEPDVLECRIVNQDLFDTLDLLPDSFVDLLFMGPSVQPEQGLA